VKAPSSKNDALQAARAKLRAAADEIVGQTFYGTLLRQMRASTLKGKYGHGGRGEEVFQAQLDQILAGAAARGRGAGISEAIVDRFERRAAAIEARRRERELETAPEAPAGGKSDVAQLDMEG
jgi:Rod binding domain-containing protein